MALYDSAGLLAELYTATREPTDSTTLTTTVGYQCLTKAQSKVFNRLAALIPNANYGAPFAMSTSDSGYTYTFGNDADSNAIFPLGQIVLFRNQNGNPGSELVPGVDFLMEGNRIRSMNYVPFSFTPYAQMVTPPLTLDASVAPILKPVQARVCLIYFGAALFFQGPLQKPDLAAQHKAIAEELYLEHLLAMKTQFFNQNAVAGLGGGLPWYSGFGTLTPLGGG